MKIRLVVAALAVLGVLGAGTAPAAAAPADLCPIYYPFCG